MSPAPETPVLPLEIDQEEELLDLFVVGGGPHALAIVSRLFEPTPNALYSEVEHARLHWIRKHRSNRTVSRDVEEGRVKPLAGVTPNGRFQLDKGPRFVVMDKHRAGWLGTWDTLFNAFGIKHLRSPLWFHPHPSDFDALKSYAECHGRADELLEIGGVVGREWSKHQKKSARVRGIPPRQPHINLRDVSDYHTPSTSLFADFIREDVIARFSLEDAVQHGTVSSIRWRTPASIGGPTPAPGVWTPPASPTAADDVSTDFDEPHFVIKTLDGRTFYSRAIVMAIGPGGIPNVPVLLRDPTQRTVVNGSGWCHTAAFLRPDFSFPPKHETALSERMAGGTGTIVVIGGGLTSAQIADLAIKKGLKVILVCRSHLKVEPFDIGIEWVGRFGNLMKHIFYQEDDPRARLVQFREARGGGSVTPPYYKVLKGHIASGALELRTLTSISALERNDVTGRWTIDLERRCENKVPRVSRKQRQPKRGRKGGSESDEADEGEADCAACPHPEADVQADVVEADYIVTATGSLFDIEGLPFLKGLHQDVPIRSAGGMPLVTEELQWREDVPFFVAGGYAGLQLGPGAANLIGSREGAERIASGLGAAFPATWGEDAVWRAEIQAGGEGDDSWRRERFGHCGGFFDALEETTA